jgi:hypothetical protein
MVNECYSNGFEFESMAALNPIILFANYYHCPEDGSNWVDCWSCACNSKCPSCGREIEPYKSLDL